MCLHVDSKSPKTMTPLQKSVRIAEKRCGDRPLSLTNFPAAHRQKEICVIFCYLLQQKQSPLCLQ